MLHKSKSKKLNQLKLIVVLPLLALFIMSFNTENIYVDSNTKEDKSIDQVFDRQEIIEIIITKNTNDENLIKIKEELKSKGITFNYSDVKRNSDGEITSISTEFISDKNSSNYNISGDNGIKSFRFKSSEGAFSIGTIDKSTFVYKAKNSNVKMQYTKGFRKVTVIDEYDNNGSSTVDVRVLKNKDTAYFVLKKNKFTFIIDDEDSNVFINESDEPIFIINGKKVEKSFFEDVDSNDIQSMSVLKGEKALEKYGEKGKNGVIIITQKPKNAWQVSTKNDSPWRIRTEVSKITYIDDNDASKNASLAFISKYSTDKVLKQHKADLENLGLKVKYSKIKRNKSGELVKIKISLSDENGRKSSATFEDNKGIINIEYGINENHLIVRSKN